MRPPQKIISHAHILCECWSVSMCGQHAENDFQFQLNIKANHHSRIHTKTGGGLLLMHCILTTHSVWFLFACALWVNKKTFTIWTIKYVVTNGVLLFWHAQLGAQIVNFAVYTESIPWCAHGTIANGVFLSLNRARAPAGGPAGKVNTTARRKWRQFVISYVCVCAYLFKHDLYII